MSKPVLLVGNGINNIRQDYRWKDLIDNLIEFIGATGQIRLDNKPFPLLYEEIFVEAVKASRNSERDIKEFIAREVSKLTPNEVHEQLAAMHLPHVLTTNYDFTLEKVMMQQTDELKNAGVIKENQYSLFRQHKIHQTHFWHIHGDANSPQSITLGYEHYSGYLQQMRNYIANGTGNAYKKTFISLVRRLKQPLDGINSWVDLFFTHDVHIVGLTMDFIEIHLWWLLTFRQRIKLSNQVLVKNHIYYYFPSPMATAISHKLDLLRSAGVTPFSITYDEKNKVKYYAQIIRKIQKRL